jgi:tripartite-type tricarboxylate transporter receptor subunit TctC
MWQRGLLYAGLTGVALASAYAQDYPIRGYNLVLGNIANLAVNPKLYRSLPYNPVKDLQPVTLIAKVPQILVVHPSLPVCVY